MKEILYIIAKDQNGKLVTATEAENGNGTFFCLLCNGSLILKKSGNSGPGSRRPHFAHKTLTPNCNPESALHFSFKTLLAKKIQEHISGQMGLQIKWVCLVCKNYHTGNLLKKVTDVKLEFSFGLSRPDLALFDESGRIIAVIEIIVTHFPQPQVVNFYGVNSIIMIQIKLNSEADIEDVMERIQQPDLVTLCTNPKCEKCHTHKLKKHLIFYQSKCERCNHESIIAYISKQNEDDYFGIWDFTKDDKRIAEERGVKIARIGTKNGKIITAGVCRNCNERLEEQQLTRFYDNPFPSLNIRNPTERDYFEHMEKYEVFKIDAGYFCPKCKF